jgi:hypothetical protein
MRISVIIHLINEDPIVCEIDKIPDYSDQFMVAHNPRRRDGKDVHYVDEEVNTIILPWHRIGLVQVLPSGDAEEIVGFVRD